MNTFTDKQISDWRRFEKVRAGGRYNMFDPNARLSAGLNKEDYRFVMDNFSELENKMFLDYPIIRDEWAKMGFKID